MVSNEQWIGISIAVLIVVLVGIGYIITDKTYFCSSRGITMECERFSGSGNRCYPNLLNNFGYRDCSDGWIKLSDYVNISIIPDNETIITETPEYNETYEWVYAPENKTWYIRPKDRNRGGGGNENLAVYVPEQSTSKTITLQFTELTARYLEYDDNYPFKIIQENGTFYGDYNPADLNETKLLEYANSLNLKDKNKIINDKEISIIDYSKYEIKQNVTYDKDMKVISNVSYKEYDNISYDYTKPFRIELSYGITKIGYNSTIIEVINISLGVDNFTEEKNDVIVLERNNSPSTDWKIISWWAFDDRDDCEDVVRGHNCTVFGDYEIRTDKSIFGASGLFLNKNETGVDRPNYVSVPDHPDFDMNAGEGNGVTWSFWYVPNNEAGFSVDQRFIIKGSTASISIAAFNDRLTFIAGNLTGTGQVNEFTDITAHIHKDVPIMITIVLNMTSDTLQTVQWYINTTLVETDTSSNTNFVCCNANANTFYIGNRDTLDTDEFNGTMDELIIFNRSLTQVEVIEWYDRLHYKFLEDLGDKILPVINGSNNGTAVSWDNMTWASVEPDGTNISGQGYAKNITTFSDHKVLFALEFEDSSDTFMRDIVRGFTPKFGYPNAPQSIGAGYDKKGLLTNLSISTVRGVTFEKHPAFIFNDTDDADYVPINGTVAFWIKANYKGTGINNIMDGAGIALLSFRSTGLSQFAFRTDDTCTSVNKFGTAPTNGEWTHIVFRKNETDLAYFKNGVEVAQHPCNGTIKHVGTGSCSSISDADCLHFGGTSTSSSFNGTLDSIRFYKGALTNAEILEVYNEKNWTDCAPEDYDSPYNPNCVSTHFLAQLNLKTNSSETPVITSVNVSYSDTGEAPPADDSPPNVTLILPLNNTLWTFNNTLTTVFNTNESCDFIYYFNSTANITGSAIVGNNTFHVNISNGNYLWNVSCEDAAGNIGHSELFNLTIDFTPPDTTPPQINFTAPTPANGTTQSQTYVTINVSIIESNLKEVVYNWNGTNFTMYNDSLVLMYNFDNVSALGENDNLVVDVSNGGNNGTVSGAIWDATGKYGGAFEFDGDGDRVAIPEAILTDGDSFTVSFWAKPDSGNTDVDSTVIDLADFWIWVQVPSDGKPEATVTGSSGQEIKATSTITTDTWAMVTITFKESPQNFTIYFNGVQEDSTTARNAIFASTVDGDGIGSFGTTSVPTREFSGNIDEVRIWNRSLSAEEIYQQYVSNLNKFGTQNWTLIVNQSQNTIDVLTNGTYTYQAYASDTLNNWNNTEQRTITISTVVGDTCDCSSIQAGTTIDCSENCDIDTCDASGQNIFIFGTGFISVSGDITNYGNIDIYGTDSSNRCIVRCNTGCFK